MLQWAREHYDFVLMDCPPLVGLADVASLSRTADICVMVIRQGVTPKAAIKLSRSSWERAGLAPVGIVLNDVPVMGYGYGDGSYYEEESDANGRQVKAKK